MQKMRLLYLFIAILFISNPCLADVITLKNGDIVEGKIIDVNKKEILCNAKINKDVVFCSFSKGQIASIELKPIKLPVRITIFDKIKLKKKENFLGKVELEMPDAIYFSLLLRSGLGIVKFTREETSGVETSYGIRKFMARVYFGFKKISYNIGNFISENIMRKRTFKLTEKNIPQILERLEEEKMQKAIAKIMDDLESGTITEEIADEKVKAVMEIRKVYSIEDFQKEFKNYLSMDKEKLYELGKSKKALMLGMDASHVEAILGRSLNIKHEDGKECWYYPDGNLTVFRKNELISYSRDVYNIEYLLKLHHADLLK